MLLTEGMTYTVICETSKMINISVCVLEEESSIVGVRRCINGNGFLK